MYYVCTKCGKKAEVTDAAPACGCGGLWELKWDVPPFDLEGIDRDTWSIFRYRKWLPLLDDGWKDVTLGEGMTPVIRFSDHLLLKMDYFMPTLSFKDRGAAVLAAHCRSLGIRSVVQDSSGNAGNSVAAYCARAGIRCRIFVPAGTSPAKIQMIRAHGAEVVIVPGSRDHCADVCRQEVRDRGAYYCSHVYNPFFYEGTKTYIYEIYEALHCIPQTLFVPLGNGTLFIGVMKALEELLRSGAIAEMPQVVAVQSEHCDPIYQAAAKGLDHIEPAEVTPTLAEGIAIGKPMRAGEILSCVYRWHIRIITAPEERILPAREQLARKGIYCEHTTAASLAAYEKYCGQYGTPEEALIPMCGAGLKSDH